MEKSIKNLFFSMKVGFKLSKFFVFLLFLFIFSLPIRAFGQETAWELVKEIDKQLETGRVLQVMKTIITNFERTNKY